MQSYGPYQIQGTLGRGGMGTVYRGQHEETGNVVAVKVLSREYSENTHFRARFESEIETLFKLHHPNIVQLISYGQENGEMFFAMELVEGRSLFAEQKLVGQFHWRDVMLMTLDVCAGLRHAHDRGVIHRDIKPGNLLLTPDRTVKITDFGIAKLFGGAQMTAHGGVVGTADFMSPEQARGEPVTQRSDLYSVGCVMYSLLTKRPPLPAKSLAEAIHKLTSTIPQRVDQYAAGVPEKLSQLIARLLEKDPEKRVGSVLALSKRLTEILDELKSQADAITEAMPPKVVLDQDFELIDEPGQGGTDSGTRLSLEQTEISKSRLPPTMDSKGAVTSGMPAAKTSAKSDVVPPKQPVTSQDDEAELTVAPLDDASPAQSQSHARQETLQETKKQSYFTEVEKARRAVRPRREPAYSAQAGPIWPYALALLLVLGLAAGGIVFVLNQVPDADQLYEVISDRADNPSAVKSEIETFLRRFPQDERVEEMEQMLLQADSGRYLRRIELKARLRGPGALLPIESAFALAMEDRQLDPVQTLERLQAVASMYESNQDQLPDSGKACLSAIQGQINRQRPIAEEFIQKHRHAIESVINGGDALEERDLPAAESCYQGIIGVYEHNSWAEDLIVEVRQRLVAVQAKLATEKKSPKSSAND
jgi:serine/threonine-protein kinase